MNATRKIIVIVALALAVCVILALKQRDGDKRHATAEPASALPRLVDVGAGTCIPCKQMMPILAELRTEYAGRLRVEYYDVRDDRNVITQYDVMTVPTQIFYDANGTELFRHTGFFAKEAILAKWKELGIELSPVP